MPAPCVPDDGPSTSAPWGLDDWTQQQFRWATKKAGGTAKQKQKALPKNLGVKMHTGEIIFPGQIIVRQRGTRYRTGDNVGLGRDHTIFATSVGLVRFSQKPVQRGDITDMRTFVSVVPLEGLESREAQEAAIARRATIKREMLSSKAFEPALHFALPGGAHG
jgi:large subunit ribosomal protein L27